MTTVMISFIAIVLFGMIMVATISYGDALGMMSAPESVEVAGRLQSAAELVSQIQTSTGSRPTSADALWKAGLSRPVRQDGSEIVVRCSNAACSPMALCLALPGTSANALVAKSAASRVKGYVSGECGSEGTAIGNAAVVTLTI